MEPDGLVCIYSIYDRTQQTKNFRLKLQISLRIDRKKIKITRKKEQVNHSHFYIRCLLA